MAQDSQEINKASWSKAASHGKSSRGLAVKARCNLSGAALRAAELSSTCHRLCNRPSFQLNRPKLESRGTVTSTLPMTAVRKFLG